MRKPRESQADTTESLRERLRILGLELERLVTLRDAATRDRNNAINLGALGILAVPAFFLWGFWIALAIAVQAVLIVVGGWYITGVHVIEYVGNIVGSSRVDLQACKLEYSIVSPK